MPNFRFEIDRTVTQIERVTRVIAAATREEAEAIADRLASDYNQDCPDDADLIGSDSCGAWSADSGEETTDAADADVLNIGAVPMFGESIAWSVIQQRAALERGWCLEQYDDGTVVIAADDSIVNTHAGDDNAAEWHVSSIAEAVVYADAEYQALCRAALKALQDGAALKAAGDAEAAAQMAGYIGVQPWTLRKAWAQRHDRRPDHRAYYHGVIRLAVQGMRAYRAAHPGWVFG